MHRLHLEAAGLELWPIRCSNRCIDSLDSLESLDSLDSLEFVGIRWSSLEFIGNLRFQPNSNEFHRIRQIRQIRWKSYRPGQCPSKP
jgi:hypothetical protein